MVSLATQAITQERAEGVKIGQANRSLAEERDKFKEDADAIAEERDELRERLEEATIALQTHNIGM